MKQIAMILFVCLIVCAFVSVVFAQDEPIVIIDNGALNGELAYIVGEPWEEADGFLSQQGTGQYLWAYPVIGPGDFHITAVLKLQEMFNEDGRGAAATLAINDLLQDDGKNGSNFGFVGGGGELFAEGNFFLDFVDMGETPVQEDTLITIEFIREGDAYRFVMDGEEMLSVPSAEEGDLPIFRSGYYRVGLRPWRSRMMVQSFTIESGAATFDPIEEKVDFIAGGQPENVVEVGYPWYAAGDAWENFEVDNFLFGDRPIFGTNYKVSARMEMEMIAGSAASFCINGDNQFGFSGGSENMFIDGDFFAGAPALDIEPPIEENVPFDFEMIGQDNKLRFLIDGAEILAMDQADDFVGFVGFRPWRSTMRIYDFSVEPLQAELEVPPEVVRSLAGDGAAVFYAGETVSGVRLTATVIEGNTSSATVVETLPEGWSATNIQTDNGAADFSGGQVVWNLEDAAGTVVLSYDLESPADASDSVAFDGTVDTAGIDGRITGIAKLYPAVAPNSEAYIVQDGRKTDYAQVVGEPWSDVDGAVERTGTGNFLLSKLAVCDVDYEIRADLTLFGLGGTAVSINLRRIPDESQSNFGFEGGSGTFFVEGEFFDDRPSFDYTTIAEGVPFTFKMVRTGDRVDFMMDDEVIHSDVQENGEAYIVGLRPWRSRMQASEFVIRTFDETPVYDWQLY